jgi:ribose 1,5-bisphosphokinase
MTLAEPIGPGRLVLIVGPSGAGKDTLIDIARRNLTSDACVKFPRRVVTRPSSQFEDNLAMTPADFDAALKAKAFALHWQAHGHGYGVPRQIDDDIRDGDTVVVNVSRTIIADARRRYRDVTVVSITAPADVLAARLAARGRASDGPIGERVQRAALQDTAVPDIVISNVGAADDHGRELADIILGKPRTAKPAT